MFGGRADLVTLLLACGADVSVCVCVKKPGTLFIWVRSDSQVLSGIFLPEKIIFPILLQSLLYLQVSWVMIVMCMVLTVSDCNCIYMCVIWVMIDTCGFDCL